MLIYENVEFGNASFCKQGDKIAKIWLLSCWRLKCLLIVVENDYAVSTSSCRKKFMQMIAE